MEANLHLPLREGKTMKEEREVAIMPVFAVGLRRGRGRELIPTMAKKRGLLWFLLLLLDPGVSLSYTLEDLILPWSWIFLTKATVTVLSQQFMVANCFFFRPLGFWLWLNKNVFFFCHFRENAKHISCEVLRKSKNMLINVLSFSQAIFVKVWKLEFFKTYMCFVNRLF